MTELDSRLRLSSGENKNKITEVCRQLCGASVKMDLSVLPSVTPYALNSSKTVKRIFDEIWY